MTQKIIKSNILLPLLGDSYRQEYTEYVRRNLRCSDAGIACNEGENCERSVYYDMTENSQKSLLSTGSLVLFDDGRIHEQDIRRRLRLVLRSPEREVTDEEIGVRGKIDNTIYSGSIREFLPDEVKNMDGDPILEIKSVNHFMFQEIENSGELPQKFYDQINYYLFLTRIKWAICLIKNRNSLGSEKGQIPFLEFIVLADIERQSELRSGMKTTKEALDKRILPPRPFLRESTQCQFCRYKHVCWPKKEEKAIIPMAPEGVAPTQELLESALKVYILTGKQLNEIKTQQEEAKNVILAYFKATGKEELLYENIKASYSSRNGKTWNMEYLKSEIPVKQLLEFMEPNEDKLKVLIAAREIDAIVLEKAIKINPAGKTLRITELKIKESNRQETPKEEVNDDKGLKRSEKVSKVRKDTPRRKSTSAGKGKHNTPKGSRLFHPKPANRKPRKR